jgi:hypothetical protein
MNMMLLLLALVELVFVQHLVWPVLDSKLLV